MTIRLILTLAMGAATVAMTGCANVKLGAPVASIDNIQKEKASGAGPMAVGEFKLAPGLAADLDKGVSIRSNQVSSPVEGSFAAYLKETLRTDLQAAGLLDPASKTVVSAQLTRSQVDAPMDTGTAKVSARFVVKRDGRTAYDRELSASDSWPSSFVGATAIPAAINHYGSLYRSLVATLFGDKEFIAAVAR